MSAQLSGGPSVGAPRSFLLGSALFGQAPPPPTSGRIKDDPDTLIWPQDLGDGRRAIVKMYRNRGAFAFLREKLSRFRVQREFEALAHLHAAGIPCSEPLAWSFGHGREHGRFEILVMAEIGAAISVMELVRSKGQEAENLDLGSLFRIVRRMHESGVFHGALKLHNILAVRGQANEHAFFVIDTPRALLYPASIVGTPMAHFDLLRLSADVARILGWPAARIPLAEYGLDEAARHVFLARMASFRATKMARARIRARALLGQAGARFAARADQHSSSAAQA